MADSDDGSSRCYIDEATGISAFNVFRLGDCHLKECFPPKPDDGDWYGIYCHCGRCFSWESDPPVGEWHSLVLLNGDFDWIRRQYPIRKPGMLILFRRDFVPAVLERKIDGLPLFLQQGFGPFQLDGQQRAELEWIVEWIWEEMASSYRFKKELLLSLILQVIHFVIKHFTWGFQSLQQYE